MAARIDHSMFFHIPRTGGNWVMESLKHACPKYKKLEVYQGEQVLFDGIHTPPTKMDTEGYKTFTFVRHPLTWYQSIYKFYSQDTNWIIEEDHPLRASFSYDFGRFIDKMLEIAPGYYSDIVKEFEQVDFVGRLEEQPFALADALDFCGEEYDFDKFWHEHVNTSVAKRPVEYTKAQEEALLTIESYVVDKYYESI